MKPRFVVSRAENLFFFVSSLSNWHFSCRPAYNDAWLKLTKPLNEKEKEILSDFGDVMKRHGFEYKNNRSIFLGRYFFISPEGKKWAAARTRLNKEDAVAFERALSLFELRFRKIWSRSKLENWAKVLNGEFKKDNVRNLFRNIEFFTGSRKGKMKVHLIASPSMAMGAAGGANIGENDLTLEVPVFRMNEWNIGSGIAVLAHEYAHVLIDRRPIDNLLTGFLKKQKIHILNPTAKNRPLKDFFKEILAGACAPYGYFCSGTLGFYEPTSDILLKAIGRKSDSFQVVMAKIIWALYPIMATHKLAEKKLDKKFLEEVYKIINSRV